MWLQDAFFIIYGRFDQDKRRTGVFFIYPSQPNLQRGLLDKKGLFSLEVSIKLLEEEVTINRVLKSIPAHVKDLREEQQKQAEKLEKQTNKLEMQTNKL